MVLAVVQTDKALQGTYSDCYSGNVDPPGYEGTLTRSVLAPTEAHVTLQLTRHDGKSLVVEADLTLSGPNTLTLTPTSPAATPWVLTRP